MLTENFRGFVLTAQKHNSGSIAYEVRRMGGITRMMGHTLTDSNESAVILRLRETIRQMLLREHDRNF